MSEQIEWIDQLVAEGYTALEILQRLDEAETQLTLTQECNQLLMAERVETVLRYRKGL